MLKKIITAYLPLRDFLYILQLEEYHTLRYMRQIPRRLWRRNFEIREVLDVTTRIKATGLLFIILLLSLSVLSYASLGFIGLLWLVVLPFLTPYLIVVCNLPLVLSASIGTRIVLRKTAKYLRKQYPDTKVIVITGSYGKTSTKYLLYELLKYTYPTAMIPKNYNTILGIANYLRQGKIARNTEYLIVEIGAHTRGDIAPVVAMLQPQMAILTALGDQHLERFGSFANLVAGKAEIFSTITASGKTFITEPVNSTLQKHNHRTPNPIIVAGDNTPHDNQALATAVATHLGVSDAFITDTLQKQKPAERRNEITHSNGVTIIDNSYNISPHTASQMLAAAANVAKQHNKKLVVMTAGIAEQGTATAVVHETFAAELNQYAARTILHPSIYAPYLQQSLTIPVVTNVTALDVLADITSYVDPDAEILLYFPEHSDLVY